MIKINLKNILLTMCTFTRISEVNATSGSHNLLPEKLDNQIEATLISEIKNDATSAVGMKKIFDWVINGITIITIIIIALNTFIYGKSSWGILSIVILAALTLIRMIGHHYGFSAYHAGLTTVSVLCALACWIIAIIALAGYTYISYYSDMPAMPDGTFIDYSPLTHFLGGVDLVGGISTTQSTAPVTSNLGDFYPSDNIDSTSKAMSLVAIIFMLLDPVLQIGNMVVKNIFGVDFLPEHLTHIKS